MPLIETEQVEGAGIIGASRYDTPEPTFMETLGAELRLENTVASTLSSNRVGINPERTDPGFDLLDRLKTHEGGKYLDQLDSFLDVQNEDAFLATAADIEREQTDREIRERSGWVSVPLTLGASLVDIPTLLPGGVLARSGVAGFRATRSALAVGAAAGVAAGAAELALQETQVTRPTTESLVNIGGSVILGSLIGAAGAKLFSRGEWDRFSRALEADLADETPNPAQVVETIVARAQSAGAASVDDIPIDDLGVGGNRLAQAVAKATASARINPGVQTMFSPS